MFMAKDGFLLYYDPKVSPNQQHFDTKPRGVIPLGGAHVEACERGPKGAKGGIQISHPDFYAGRKLILCAENAEAQKAWIESLTDCSRVTMENALLGDSMIEQLRAAGTSAAKEKQEIMEELQKKALALKLEQEENLKLLSNQEHVLATAAEAEERAKKKEAEMSEVLAELEKRRTALEQEANDIQREVNNRAAALNAANAEYEKIQSMLSSAGGGSSTGSSSGVGSSSASSKPGQASATSASSSFSMQKSLSTADASSLSPEELQTMQRRARALEQEKLLLEREKAALEKSVRDMASTTAQLQSNLMDAEESKKRLEFQMKDLSNEEGDLAKERALRRRLERKLQIAEESLKRLDAALKRSGAKLDVDVFADVKTLLAFFEERVDEVRRDAQRIEIMKKALKAKRRYLVQAARADGTMEDHDDEAASDADEDTWGDDTVVAPKAAPAPAPVPVAKAPAPAPAANARDEDQWSDNESQGNPPGPSRGGSFDENAPKVYEDAQGPLPKGWTLQKDDEGDVWYYNELSQETSWVRPNPDGTIPPQEQDGEDEFRE
jgi:WW domain/PH domain